MTNTSSIIKPNPDYPDVAKKVIRPAAIRHRMEYFYNKPQKDLLDNKGLQKLSRHLLKLDTPANPDIMKKFQINEADILPGMYCERCGGLSVVKHKEKWLCPKCGHTDKDAHIRALIDYYLLKGPFITNRQCREFLRLPTMSVTSKLLASLNLFVNRDI